MEGYASTPIIFLSTFIVGLIQFIFILRLIFEITQVNFYNPVCQMIVKFTDPVLKPLEVIPLNLGRINLILIIILTLLTSIKLFIPYSISGNMFCGPYTMSVIDINLKFLLIYGFGELIDQILDILWWVIIIGAIGSWFMGFNSHPIFNLIDDICQPFYNIIRRILPPMSGLDFSPIILLVLITLTELILVPPIYHFASLF